MKYFLLTVTAILIAFLSSGQVVSTFPFTEDFETQILGPTACGPIYSFSQTPPSWYNGDDASFPTGAHQLDWTVDEGGTSSSPTGPSVDHTIGTALGNYIYLESSCGGQGYPGINSELISSWMDFTALAAPNFMFWYHMYGSSMGTMSIDVQQGSAGVWDLSIIPDWTDNIDLWQTKEVDLFAYAGMDSVRIRIRNLTGADFFSDVALDDLSVYEAEAYDIAGIGFDPLGCGLGITPITVSYRQIGSDTILPGDSLIMYYDDGITSMMETFILMDSIFSGDTISYTFSALANFPNSVTYNAMSWATHLGDTTNINDTIWHSFIPKTLVDSFPYLENYESGKNGWKEDNTSNGAVNGTWAHGTAAKTVIIGAASGNNAWVSGGLTGDYIGNDNSWVAGPCFNFTNLDTGACVAMKIWWNCEFSWDGANLQWSIDDITWNNLGNYGDPNNWYNDNSITGVPGGNAIGWTGRTSTSNGSNGWVQAYNTIPDTLIGMPYVKLRVNFGSDASLNDDGFGFDDFSIGMPDSLDTMMADVSQCSPINFAYGKTGFYNWETQDTATAAVITSGTNIDGIISLSNYSATDTTFNLIVSYVDASGSMPFIDTVLVTLLATPYNQLQDTIICWNETIVYHVDSASCYTYAWNDITSSTVDSAAYSTGGTVSVTVTHATSGCSHTATAILNQTPSVDLPVTVNFCPGDTAILDAGANFVTYLWSTTEISQSIAVTTPGNYAVTTIDTIACISLDAIIVTSNIPMPVITGQQDTLCTYSTMVLNGGSGFASYSWSSGGSLENETINGAILPLGSNTITVFVTDTNGCVNSDSTIFTVDQCVGINEFETISMIIYPNPSNGQFSYTINKFNESAMIIVTDIVGKTVLEKELSTANGIIDLSAFENGVYILKLYLGNTINTMRLIKQ
jgi:MAM domain, meprin/A5/mu/Secretion system C-terminal sorting domain